VLGYLTDTSYDTYFVEILNINNGITDIQRGHRLEFALSHGMALHFGLVISSSSFQ
jgi:hypothetical protein